jgi:Invasion associated locus B (IalB) protein
LPYFHRHFTLEPALWFSQLVKICGLKVNGMNWNRAFFTLLQASVLAIATSGLARADDPVSLGTFDDWESFTYQASNAPVCYVYSVPKKSDSAKKVKRDPIYFLVTHFPGRKIRNQVSTIIGYPFKESSMVTVKVDDASFELYTNGDAAWAAAAETEASIVKAMKTGKSLTVTGTSWKGTETTDTYSLVGVSAALDKIDSACK